MGTVTSSAPPTPAKPSKLPPHPDKPPVFHNMEEIHDFVDKVFPGPHRCNPRMDDFLEGLLRLPPAPRGTFGVFLRCARSEVGQEPTEPFKNLKPDYFEKTKAQYVANRNMLRNFYLDQAIMREEQELEYVLNNRAGEFSAQNIAPLIFGPNSSGSRGYDSTGQRGYPKVIHEDLTPFVEEGWRTRVDARIEMMNRDPDEIEFLKVQKLKRAKFLDKWDKQQQERALQQPIS